MRSKKDLLPPPLLISTPRLFTTAQAALILGVRPQSLRVRRMRGQTGPPYIKLCDSSANGNAYYPEDALAAWISRRPRFRSTGDEKVALTAEEKAAFAKKSAAGAASAEKAALAKKSAGGAS